MLKFLMVCVVLAAMASAAPTHTIVSPVSPVILPKVHLSSPDVTVVKQPYVIQQTEPVYRQVYYTDPLALHVPYVSHHVPAVYHQTAYGPAVNYIV